MLSCNSFDTLTGYARYGNNVTYGKTLNLVHILNINRDGVLKVEIIDAISYLEPGALRINLQNTVRQTLDLLRESHALLQQQNINIIACCTDNGFLNPARNDIQQFTESISCSSHEVGNCLFKMFGADGFYVRGALITLIRLTAIFNHHQNPEITRLLTSLWKMFTTFKNPICRLQALMRHFDQIDLFSTFELMRNLQWDVLQQQHVPLLISFMEAVMNLRRTVQLLSMRMSDEHELEMRDLAVYFLNVTRFNLLPVLIVPNSFAKLATCLNFYAQTFHDTQVPFVPRHISIDISYDIKEEVRFVQKNDVMPTHSDFVSSFAEMHDRGQHLNGFCDYSSLKFEIAPTAHPLRHFFMSHGSIAIDPMALARIPNQTLRLYPQLINAPRAVIEIILAIMQEARNARRVDSILIGQHALLIEEIIKIEQHKHAYNFQR